MPRPLHPPPQTTLAHALRPHPHPALTRQPYSSPARLTPEPLDGQGAVRLALTWDEILLEYSTQQSSPPEPQLEELSAIPAATTATAAATAAALQPPQQLLALPTSQQQHLQLQQQQAPGEDELVPAPSSFNPAAGNTDAFRPLDVTIRCWAPYDGSGLEPVAGQRWVAISFTLLDAQLATLVCLQVCANMWDTAWPFDLASLTTRTTSYATKPCGASSSTMSPFYLASTGLGVA